MSSLFKNECGALVDGFRSQGIAALIEQVAAVALDPACGDFATVRQGKKLLPVFLIGHRLPRRINPALALPALTPLGQALQGVLAIRHELYLSAFRDARQAFDGRYQLCNLVGLRADIAASCELHLAGLE